MKAYADFRSTESLFRKDLRENIAMAHAALLAACSHSTDPDVRGRYAEWQAKNEMETFLESRKESDER